MALPIKPYRIEISINPKDEENAPRYSSKQFGEIYRMFRDSGWDDQQFDEPVFRKYERFTEEEAEELCRLLNNIANARLSRRGVLT